MSLPCSNVVVRRPNVDGIYHGFGDISTSVNVAAILDF